MRNDVCNCPVSENKSLASDILVALFVLISLTPILILNTLVALATLNSPLTLKGDFNGVQRKFYAFNYGLFKDALILLNVVLFRTPLIDDCVVHNSQDIKTGLIGLSSLRAISGLQNICNDRQGNQSIGIFSKIWLVSRYFIASELYRKVETHSDNDFSLFNVRVNNETLKQALEQVVTTHKRNETNLFFFINVNSINQARTNVEFTSILNSSNKSYADGSGMRIGARRIGVSLKDNLNGTDLFPHICQRAQEMKKSVYLLGAAPGVADAAAQWVSKQYPSMKIAGVQHGYFSSEENGAIVDSVNDSGADILLVAMGSPVQEGWLVENKSKLKCSSALAVGGLFDFYSGRISRAPMWVRELGMEWIWRLANEPVNKFNRYVIGNPWFMYSLFSKAPEEVGQTIK